MIGYICKYTPVELLSALGGKPELLNNEVDDFACADRLAHPNLCFQAKAFLQHSRDVDRIILVSCCDSLRRVYDILQARESMNFSTPWIFPMMTRAAPKLYLKKSL